MVRNGQYLSVKKVRCTSDGGQAARLLGKAEAIRVKEVIVIPISERQLIDPIIERLHSGLGKETFDSARAAANR